MKSLCITVTEARRLLDAGSVLIVRPVKDIPLSASGFIVAADGSGDIKFYNQAMAGVRVALGPWRKSPFGKPGDRVALRETWTEGYHLGRWTGYYYYKADNNCPEAYPCWLSPATMPQWAIRPAFRSCTVESVECKRVSEITVNEAVEANMIPFAENWTRRYGKKHPFETDHAWFAKIRRGGSCG